MGCKEGRSVDDALNSVARHVDRSPYHFAMAIFFDITSAFDSLWWPSILNRLASTNIPREWFTIIENYFCDRTITITTSEYTSNTAVTRGCPQGSVLAPFIWCAIFNEVLEVLQKQDIFAVAYVDDLCVIVEAKSRRQLQTKGQIAVNHVNEWCSNNKLTIAAHKTKLLSLRGNFDQRRPPTIICNGASLALVQEFKYLAITLQRGMHLHKHAELAAGKVVSKWMKIKRL